MPVRARKSIASTISRREYRSGTPRRPCGSKRSFTRPHSSSVSSITVAMSGRLPDMATVIELTDDEWGLVKDLFDPQGRRGVPERYSRREMVDAMLFLARTGIQWRYLPERYPPWSAVWQQWRRWRANGVWARAMVLLAHAVRILKKRPSVEPSMVMIDAQTVR